MSPRLKLTRDTEPLEAVEAVVPAEHAPEGAVGDTERGRMIAEAAYYRAQKRGFAPGADLEDWLAAEREIDALAREAT
jgi:hypothetical protein